jgi:transcriptional regulator with XRE-family HTH domain
LGFLHEKGLLLSIGNNIRKVRKARGLSQRDLAAHLGKAVTTIQKYENGKFIPTIDVIEQIAEILETTPFKLLETDNWKSKFPDLKKDVSGIDGFIAILTDIYGYAELEKIEGANGTYAYYYFVGTGKNTFALKKTHVDDSYNLTKEIIEPLIDRIKDTRSKDEIRNELNNSNL